MLSSRRIALAPIALLISLLLLCCGNQDDDTIVISDGDRNVDLRVEVADEEGELSQGLSDHESLPTDEGMLFVFPRDVHPALWMHGTSLALEAAFLDSTGTVLEIVDLEPHSLEVHEGPAGARYALEVNSGWFAAHGLDRWERLAVESLEEVLDD